MYVRFLILTTALLILTAAAPTPQSVTITYSDGSTKVMPGPFTPGASVVLPILPDPGAQPLPVLSTPTMGTYRFDKQTKTWKLTTFAFALDPEGWLIFPRQSTAQELFISANGQDTSPGTEAAPLKTYKRALQLRDPSRQTLLRFKAGEYHSTSLTSPPSGSPLAPTMLSSYGQGQAQISQSLVKNGKYIIFSNLAIRGDGVPNANSALPAGLQIYDSDFIVVEGCNISDALSGIIIDGTRWMQDILLYRNVIHFNHSDKQNRRNSEGLYTYRVNGLTDDSSIYVSNGHKPGYSNPTWFNHNIYHNAVNDNLVMTNILSTQASANGAQVRCGGRIDYFLGIDNPNQLAYGLVNGGGHQYPFKGVSGSITNAVLEGTRAFQSHGFGLSFANIQFADFEKILITGAPLWAVSMESGKGDFENEAVGIHNLSMKNIQVFKSTGGFTAEASLKKGVFGKKDNVSNVALTGYYTPAPSSKNWTSLAVTTSIITPQTIPLSVDDYARSIGLGNKQGYINAALQQRKGNWKSELEPKTVINWIQRSMK